MTERAAVRLPKKANYRGLKITFAKYHFAFIFSPDVSLPSKATSCNWRSDARQSEIRDGSVLAYVTRRIAAITPPRTLVVLRFLLNTTDETHCILPNPITLYYLNNYIRSAETGEIFGLVGILEG